MEININLKYKYDYRTYKWRNDEPDYMVAHYFSTNNRSQLEHDNVCGCYFCCKIFSPAEIKEYAIEDEDSEDEVTAICPYCGIDSVIGESSGYQITDEFLGMMRKHWFQIKT